MNTRKLLILFALCSLLFTIYTIQDTFAKYKTDATATTNISIARWKILVNEQDIKENRDFSNTISPVFNGNDNVAEGIIAPNSEGYFDIDIDGSSADVSFKYTTSIEVADDSAVKDLIITGYTVDDGTTNTFPEDNYTITNNILYNQANKTKHYRFFVKWDDSENATMDNAADTTAASGSAKFKVNISFIQLASQ